MAICINILLKKMAASSGRPIPRRFWQDNLPLLFPRAASRACQYLLCKWASWNEKTDTTVHSSRALFPPAMSDSTGASEIKLEQRVYITKLKSEENRWSSSPRDLLGLRWCTSLQGEIIQSQLTTVLLCDVHFTMNVVMETIFSLGGTARQSSTKSAH